MKINQPIANAAWGPLMIRLPLGAYFILAGLTKFQNMPTFMEGVRDLHVLPTQVAMLYGTLLPYIEIITGVLLVIGLWTTLASLFAVLMLGSFTYALGVFPHKTDLFNKDLILLGGALSLMFLGSGTWSVDKIKGAST